MVALLLTTIFILLCLSLGWLLASWLDLKASWEKLGTSMLLGLWLITLAMMLSYQATNIFSREITLGLVFILNFIVFILIGANRRRAVTEEVRYLRKNFGGLWAHYKGSWSRLNRLESLLLIIISIILVQIAWSNLTWPVSDWDSIALYDFRAILIQRVGNWSDGVKLGYFYQYPPYTSLLHGATYLFGWEQVKIWYSVLFISFMLVFYAFLRQQVPRLQAIIGIFLLLIAPLVSDHLTVAYTNLPYTIYFCVGFLYLWRWLVKQDPTDMKLAFIFSAAACWIRASEPFWIIAFLIIIAARMFVVKNIKWQTVLLFSGLFLVLVRYWPTYVDTLNIPPPPPVANQATGLIDAVTPVTIVKHAFTVSQYLFINAVLPLITLVLPTIVVIFWDRKLQRTLFYKAAVTSLVLLGLSVAAGTYFFSFTYSSWDAIGPSLTRLMMSLVPLLIYFISVSNLWKIIFKHVTFEPIRASKPGKR